MAPRSDDWERRYSPEPPLLPGERWVRFACGGLFGAGAGFASALRWGNVHSAVVLIALMGLCAVGYGLFAAYRCGRSWRSPCWWLAGLFLVGYWLIPNK